MSYITILAYLSPFTRQNLQIFLFCPANIYSVFFFLFFIFILVFILISFINQFIFYLNICLWWMVLFWVTILLLDIKFLTIIIINIIIERLSRMFRLEISLRSIRVSFLYVVLIVMIFLEKFLNIVCDFFVFSYQVTNNFYIVARYSDVFGIEEQFRVVPLD